MRVLIGTGFQGWAFRISGREGGGPGPAGGDGRGPATTGRHRAAACASSRLWRTACIATRAADALTEVSSATISTCCCFRIRCTAQALSLPVLHDIHALGKAAFILDFRFWILDYDDFGFWIFDFGLSAPARS